MAIPKLPVMRGSVVQRDDAEARHLRRERPNLPKPIRARIDKCQINCGKLGNQRHAGAMVDLDRELKTGNGLADVRHEFGVEVAADQASMPIYFEGASNCDAGSSDEASGLYHNRGFEQPHERIQKFGYLAFG